MVIVNGKSKTFPLLCELNETLPIISKEPWLKVSSSYISLNLNSIPRSKSTSPQLLYLLISSNNLL